MGLGGVVLVVVVVEGEGEGVVAAACRFGAIAEVLLLLLFDLGVEGLFLIKADRCQ